MNQGLMHVLVHAAHGRTRLDAEMHGVRFARMLNVTGRWSSKPTKLVPVLTWPTKEDADRAAEICRRARGAEVVVQQIGGTVFVLGEHLAMFGPAHEAALKGYLPYDGTAAKKAEAARLKCLASAGYLVGTATEQPQLVERSRALASHAGSGAPDYLTGGAGGAMAAAIIEGRAESDAVITREHVARAVEIASAIVAERLGSDSFGRR